MQALCLACLLLLCSTFQAHAQSSSQDTVQVTDQNTTDNLPENSAQNPSLAIAQGANQNAPTATPTERQSSLEVPRMPRVEVEYKRGGGLQFLFPDQQAKFRLRAYLQSRYDQHFRTENEALQSAFSIQRARLDVRLQLMDKYSLVVELDARGGASALAAAFADAWYVENHGVRIGKFNTPFSPEDMRSSRNLSTIARYNAITSITKLPAIDKQIGVMAMGSFFDKRLGYWFSLTNGNGKGSDNLAENNNAKDLELRLDYRPIQHLTITGSLNLAEELNQELRLLDHTSEKFNVAQVGGKRTGVLAAAEYQNGRFLARSEWFRFEFDESLQEGTQDINSFWGGVTETGYFINGDQQDGIQLIARYEHAEYNDFVNNFNGPTSLHSYILGTNLFIDGLFRIQVNGVFEDVNSPISLDGSRFEGHDNSFTIMSLVQIKI